MFSAGQPLKGLTGEYVDGLDRRVANHESNNRADGYGHFYRQCNRAHSGNLDGGERSHCGLHGKRACGRPVRSRRTRCRKGPRRIRSRVPAVVTVVVEPTRDGIAAEGQHAPPLGVDLGDKRVVDSVQLHRQCLRPALGTECRHERLSQRRETGDVSEESGTGCTRRQVDATHQRVASIGGEIGERRFAQHLGDDALAVTVRPSRRQVMDPLENPTENTLLRLPARKIWGWPRRTGNTVNVLSINGTVASTTA